MPTDDARAELARLLGWANLTPYDGGIRAQMPVGQPPWDYNFVELPDLPALVAAGERLVGERGLAMDYGRLLVQKIIDHNRQTRTDYGSLAFAVRTCPPDVAAAALVEVLQRLPIGGGGKERAW